MANINIFPSMILQARGFKYIFDGLNQDYIENFINEKFLLPNDADFIAVTATNASFCCEIYLKAIFVYEHRNDNATFSETHNLRHLFKEISKKNRDKIIDSLYQKYNYTAHMFWHELDNIADNFVDFRYLFEKTTPQNLNLSFFNKFIKELDIFVNNIANSFEFPDDVDFNANTIEISKS